MSVSYTLPAVEYVGNNSTATTYAIPFPFLETDYVYAAVTSGLVTTELAPAAITVVQDADEQGGTLSTAVAVPVTDTITIFRRTAQVQPLEFPTAGAFPAESHERALDRLTHITQELNNAILALQSDATNISVPTSGGAQDFTDTAYFISDTARTAAAPTRLGQLAVAQLQSTLKYGTSTAVGAWRRMNNRTLIFNLGTISGSNSLNFDDNDLLLCTLGGATTFTFATKAGGYICNVLIRGDTGTPYGLTWPAGVKWEGGSAPSTVAAGEWLYVEMSATSSSDVDVYARFFRSDGGATSVSKAYLTASTTSFAIGTGSKAFTVDTDLDYAAGDWVSMVSAAAPTVDYMLGQVTAYTGATLTVNVTVTAGGGTKTDWAINLAGRPGDTGPSATPADNSLLIFIESPTAKSYVMCQYATTAGTITNLIAKLGSGSTTIAVKINGVDVTGLAAVAVTTAESITAATALNTFVVGDTITVVDSIPASAADLSLVIQIT